MQSLLCPPSSKTPPPITYLKTIFIDNGAEREGDNIEQNITIMTQFISGTFDRPSHSDSGRNDQLLAKLVAAARKVDTAQSDSVNISKYIPDVPLDTVSKPELTLPNASIERPVGKVHANRRGEEKRKVPASPFISTVRNMYGNEMPNKPRYAQDRELAITGLQKQVANANIIDDVDEEDEDNHLNTAPSGLSRILKTNGTLNKDQYTAKTCPHCDLSRDDPPVFQMMPTSTQLNIAPSLNTSAAIAASTLQTRATHFRNALKRRYGNLALGIITPKHTLENLWNLVAILQPPKPLQTLSHPPSLRGSVPQLSTDEWAIMASKHFADYIGAPPWQEYFVRKKTDIDEWTRKVQETCDNITLAIREEQKASDKIKFRLGSLERVVEMRNPSDERLRLRSQAVSTQQDLLMRKWELEDVQRRTERDRLLTMKDRALIAIAQEEIRRLLAQIIDMVAIHGRLALPNHQDLSRKAKEAVFSVLEELPTSRGGSVKRAMATSTDAHQCCSCLMLTATSPYCPVTGAPHSDLTLNLFHDLGLGGPSYDASPAHEDLVEEHLETSIKPNESFLPSPSAGSLFVPRTVPLGLGHIHIPTPNHSSATTPLRTPLVVNSRSAEDTINISSHKLVAEVDDDAPESSDSSLSSDEDETEPPLQKTKESIPKGAKAMKTTKSKISTVERKLAKSRARAEALRQKEIDELLGSGSDTARSRTPSASDAELLSSDEMGSIPGSFVLNSVPEASLSQSNEGPKRFNRGARKNQSRGRQHAGSPSGNKPMERPSTVAMEVMAHHIWSYLSAAADKNFPAMRQATRQLTGPSCSVLFTDATLRGLAETEEQFYSWYSVVGQLPSNTTDVPTTTLVKRAKATSYKIVEQKCISLKKELRNLEWAFHKRPKARSGALLDNSSFAALALKITDLEKKNAALRIKLRQVNEQRRAITRSVPASPM